MFIGQLVKTIAEATGVPDATVTVYARVLREAGLIASGARGVNAPKMTTTDAARLLLAMIITDKPSRAAEAVADFGSLRCSRFDPHDRKEWRGFTFQKARKLPDEHTFEQAIGALIDMYAFDTEKRYFEAARPKLHRDSVYSPICEISVRLFQVDATVNISGGKYYYHDPFIMAQASPVDMTDVDTGLNQMDEYHALTAAHIAKSEKYMSLIRVEKKVFADVIDAIAVEFRDGSE